MPAVLLAWLLVGCGAEPVPMLHERSSFDGRIILNSDTLSLTGELVFDRQSRYCQLTRRQPTTVALGRNPAGKLFAFEDGKPRPMGAEEQRQLRAVLALVDGKGVTAPHTHDQSYSVQLPPHGRVRVTIEETAARPHGQRR